MNQSKFLNIVNTLDDGVWELNPTRNMFYEKIVEIAEVREGGVTVWVYRNGTVTMSYEEEKEATPGFPK